MNVSKRQQWDNAGVSFSLQTREACNFCRFLREDLQITLVLGTLTPDPDVIINGSLLKSILLIFCSTFFEKVVFNINIS